MFKRSCQQPPVLWFLRTELYVKLKDKSCISTKRMYTHQCTPSVTTLYTKFLKSTCVELYCQRLTSVYRARNRHLTTSPQSTVPLIIKIIECCSFHFFLVIGGLCHMSIYITLLIGRNSLLWEKSKHVELCPPNGSARNWQVTVEFDICRFLNSNQNLWILKEPMKTRETPWLLS